MNCRWKTVVTSLVLVVCACIMLCSPAIGAAAPHKGTGGWYWPTGTEKLGSMDGYWVYRASNHSWHMAKDISAPQGHPVYAIADGVIAESKADAGYGGVLVVWHQAGDGTKFLTVYGHIKRQGGTAKGAKVRAGQLIGKTNAKNHLHFGIHPGDKYPPDGNPFRGHTYDSHQTYGWVDPIKFLRTHPAYLGYSAPALPLTTTISTAATPTVLGVANGCVYWDQPSDEGSCAVYECALPSGESTEVATGTPLPAFEASRYLSTVGGTWLKLWDRWPLLTAAYSTLVPAWGRGLSITGTLKNAAGKPFAGATICLERSTGGKWTAVSKGVTGTNGAYALHFAPPRRYSVRVRFTPPKSYAATVTAEVTIVPQPGLHAPDSLKQAKSGGDVVVGGMLDARHTAGARSVTLHFQRYTSGAWHDARTATAVNANAGKSATRYTCTLNLAAGSWRVCASCKADSLHTAQTTKWAPFAVK